VVVYPKIQASKQHPLQGVSVALRYETGYVGFNGPDVNILAIAATASETILSRGNLTGYAFNDCHEQRCYSPLINGTVSFDAALEGEVSLEIHFANHDLNLQLLLPLEFELHWGGSQVMEDTRLPYRKTTIVQPTKLLKTDDTAAVQTAPVPVAVPNAAQLAYQELELGVLIQYNIGLYGTKNDN